MYVKLDEQSQMDAANKAILQVVKAVNPALAVSIDMDGDWPGFLKEHATRAELEEIRERVRPLGERSFDDPLARYLFCYFPVLKIKKPDISYLVDEFEKLKDEELTPDLKRVLDFDLSTLVALMGPEHVEQLDRLLRLESDTIFPQQSGVIQVGVRKKFFREADALQWLASSRFRGANKYLDGALDRMQSFTLAAPKDKVNAQKIVDSVEADDGAVGGAIPVYVSVPAKQFVQWLELDCAARAEAVFNAVEDDRMPVEDIDKSYVTTYRILAEYLGVTDADAAVYGAENWDPGRNTDGLKANNPETVTRLAGKLGGIDLATLKDASAVGELATIYAQAVQRGDGIVILMN
ncbi:hypothetical protein QP968_06210 [Corynebacterium sp. MSK041]|uniref:hypothetical protein n=1 Tax=Corynebacterium sp. MSK041 TaxID=3050194 RepID=UPI00254F804B|nr:hypothetical protein [Corynebacterium sp. MSK041]MDK8795303.1 hypothetical protein [Corynebacterium sp. MSK041]